MLRAFQIVALVFSVIFLIVALVYIEEASHERWSSYYNPYDSYGSYSSYGRSSSHDASYMGGILSLVFLLLFAAVHILSMIKIKTTTMKVISIIGISLTGIGLLLSFLVISSPGASSYDEVGPVFVLYSLAAIAFHIVGTIHAFRKGV